MDAISVFEQHIKAAQRPGQRHSWPKHTIGDLITAIMRIHDAPEAKAFRNSYIEWLQHQPDLDKRGAAFVADSNIGWCFGEGMSETDRAMWRTLGATHPIFGSMRSDPSSSEAFAAAKKAATQCTR